jgi:AcrR family transcriptional regulator
MDGSVIPEISTVAIIARSPALTVKSMQFTGLNMRSKRVINAPPSATRDAIAAAAAKRFARSGVEHTTMRQIVQDAGISLGTINFHFGSKLGLAHEVFERLAREVCESRHAEYDALERAARGKPVALEALFRALIRPYVEGDEHKRQLVIYVLRELKLAKQDLARDSVARHFDRVAVRTVKLIRQGQPHLSEDKVWWRYSLGLGAVLSIVSDCGPDNRLKRLSHRIADASDRTRLVEEAVGFWVRGFGSSTPRRKSGKPTDVATTSREGL